MIFLVLLSQMLFFYCRTRHYLGYFQQEEYDGKRFLQWLFSRRVFDRRGSLMSLIMLLSKGECVFLGFGFILIAYLENNPLKNGKIFLKMTPRAKRIFYLSLLVELFVLLPIYAFTSSILFWALQIVFCQLIFIFLPIANIFLRPYEKQIQNKFYRQAKEKYNSCNLYTIGITGSYGKTSVKNMLGEVLQVTKGATFWPAKGVNTLMGIVSQIRSKLSKFHEYAVIEMGAYHRGSIAELCRLTPPDAAIITAVGLCHLERFGSKENILNAKSELAQAVNKNGILVYNGDDEGASVIATRYPKKVNVSYGFDSSRDCYISEYYYSLGKGCNFKLIWKDNEYFGQTKLYGKTALLNIMATFSMAVTLGADPQYVLGAICNLEGVDNRLQLKSVDGIHFLNDGYNSNSAGFDAALELMRDLPAKRRILMTPGMIELGECQHRENYMIAKKAADICDIIIIVGEVNKAALLSGLNDGGCKNFKYFDGRDTALEYIHNIKQVGDLILIENDLTDIYEAKVRL